MNPNLTLLGRSTKMTEIETAWLETNGCILCATMNISNGSACILISLLACMPALCQERDINALLMESTFKVEGVSKKNPKQTSGGTVFFLGRPLKNDPSHQSYVLVTAKHVLDDMAGDDAVISLREKQANGAFRKVQFRFKFRSNGKDLYVHHPEADVAAMYLVIPIADQFPLLTANFLADDAVLRKYEFHPGDQLSCLGFPLGAESNEMGFPILRNGYIASYPLVPTKTIKSFLIDFHVFPGNSGGPVYFGYAARFYGGVIHPGYIRGIVGLVTQQAFSTLPDFKNQPLDIGVVVPSEFIIDTIKLLPEL